MLQITARLFKNNQLIGYEITNGTQIKRLSRIDTWMYAKNKQILNVVATGSEVEPRLSGINGFKLKKLPKFQYISAMEKLPEMNMQDILAAGIRLILNGFIAENNTSDISGRDYLQNKYKEHLKVEVRKGKIDATSVRSLSRCFTIISTLDNPYTNASLTGRGMSTAERIEWQRKEFEKNKQKVIKLQDAVETVIIDIVNAAKVLKSEKGIHIADAFEISNSLKSLIYVETVRDTIKYKFDDTLGEMQKTLDLFFAVADGIGDKEDNQVVLDDIITSGDKALEEFHEIVDKVSRLKYVPRKEPVPISPIIGYRLKYTGDIPVNTFRMTASSDHTLIPFTIQPGQEICLNRAEMSILASNPEIGCTFANGKMMSSFRKFEEKYDMLSANYFSFNPDVVNGGLDVNDSNIKKHVTDFVDAKTVATFFIPVEQPTQPVNKTSHQQETLNKLRIAKNRKA